MFDKIRKVPLIEISIILLLNIVMIIVGAGYIFTLLGLVEDGIQPDVADTIKTYAAYSFFITGFFIGVYLDIFTLSINRSFLKTIYYFKSHKIMLIMLLMILLFLSPSFLLGFLPRSPYGFIPGCYLSNAFPLIILSLYSSLYENITIYIRTGSKIVNITGRIVIFVLILLSLGFIFWKYPEQETVFRDLWWLHSIIILLTIPVLLTEEVKILIDWLKRKILYVIPLSVLLASVLIYRIQEDLVTYYTIYLFALFYLILILSKPVLALKTKNRKIMEEIELEDKTVQCLLREAQEQNNV